MLLPAPSLLEMLRGKEKPAPMGTAPGKHPTTSTHHPHPLRNGDFFNPTAPRDTTGSLGQPETP